MREARGINSCWTGRLHRVILALQTHPPQVAMKLTTRILRQSSLALLLFLCACEKPKQRVSSEPQEAPAPEASAPEVAAPVATPALSVTPPTPPAPEGKASEDEGNPTSSPDPEPELSVAMEGKKIIVSGALRSKIQVDRILEALKREFLEHEIENSLVVDYDRMGVGWGNRVADEFLVPFLQQVANAKVTYRESVVTLDGEVKSPGEIRMIAEIAVPVFSGSTTQDLKNNLKVSAPAKP